MITDAAASQTPITVNELLTRSEKLALNDASGSPENRAAVLEMIADRYFCDGQRRARGAVARACVAAGGQVARRGAALSPHLQTRRRIGRARTCRACAASRCTPRSGASTAIRRPRASACSTRPRSISPSNGRREALRDAQLGLEKSRQAGNGGVIEAALLGTAGYAYHLNARDVEAERYFDQSLRKYRELGREHSDGALAVLNDWGVSMLAQACRGARWSCWTRACASSGERGPDIELTATVRRQSRAGAAGAGSLGPGARGVRPRVQACDRPQRRVQRDALPGRRVIALDPDRTSSTARRTI